MTKRGKKKAEKLKRKAIHKMLDLALDINGAQASRREITGERPTAFFYMSGHVGKIDVDVHPFGWGHDKKGGEQTRVEAWIGMRSGDYALSEAVRRLEEIKAELMREREKAPDRREAKSGANTNNASLL